MSEEMYNCLDDIDKYVVDNYEKFVRGLALDNIIIPGYSQKGIAMKIKDICTAKRMRINTYRKIVNNNDETIPDKSRVTVYFLKPKEHMSIVLYNIIEEKNNSKNKEEITNLQNIPKICNESVEDIIYNNTTLFITGVKRKWLLELGIYNPRLFEGWFYKRTFRCKSKNARNIQETYKELGINENIYKDDFMKKKITLYCLLYIP